MFCIFLDAEVPCHVFSFPRHFTDDTGLTHFLFFHFADDMGVCVFWVCPTTPMSAAGTIYIHNHIKKMKHIFKYI